VISELVDASQPTQSMVQLPPASSKALTREARVRTREHREVAERCAPNLRTRRREPANSYVVKLDGFRAIDLAGEEYRVRSRRGWDMTQPVPALQALPEGVYCGELVPFDDGIPWFPDVCAGLAKRRPQDPPHLRGSGGSRRPCW
jgi:ATP-dependent DNA ligase